jgi:hypothetical protein
MLFIDCPRILEEPDYLFAKLKAYLPADISADHGRKAHEAVTKKGNVRIEAELCDTPAAFEGLADPGLAYPTQDRLDGVALRREVGRLRREVATLKSSLECVESKCAGVGAELKAQEALAERAEEAALVAARERDAVYASTLWRATRPLRSLGSKIPPALRSRWRKGR